jgi:hypothetical protein
MHWNLLMVQVLVAPAIALIRFPCSQLVVESLDPLLYPGRTPSPHLHQVVGGASYPLYYHLVNKSNR